MNLKSLYPPVIPADKANHFFYGALIALAVLVAAKIVTLIPAAAAFAPAVLDFCQIVAAGVVAAAGFLKEKLDKKSNDEAVAAGEQPTHGVERADFLWTCYGGLTVVAATLLFHQPSRLVLAA